MGLLILFFVLSIAFSFLCSVLEAVLLSVTPSYVQVKLQEGTVTGKLLSEYKDDIDRPLSAVLTLNTIAHTVGAIGVGAQAGAIFGDKADMDLGFFHLSYESIIAALMTLAILVLSEIIPKTIGANSWQALAPFTVRTLKVLLWVLKPFVWISQKITKTLKKEKDRSILSRADFTAMTMVGAESGALEKHESTIIKNLLEFEKLDVRDIMTPKTVLIMGRETLSLKDYYQENTPIRFSRIPVFRENRDDVTGIVLKDELLQKLVEAHGDIPLKDIKREVSFVQDDLALPALFDHFTAKRDHLSMVVDNYGSVVGLVTMEDLFETLLGQEIMDEMDEVADLQKLARRKWEERFKKKENKPEP